MTRKRTAFDPAFVAVSPSPLDLDEVTYMRLYRQTELPFQVKAAPTTQPRQAQPTTPARPLVDVVTPQPKAFFAYLRMPKPETSTKRQSSRIKRTRRKGNLS